MNISTVFPSKYLKAAELEDDTTYTISEVKVEEMGQGADADSKPVLYFEETEKGFACNKTNANTIAGLYGPETDEWVGKPVTLYATEVEYGGKMMLGIRVRLRPSKPVARPAAKPTGTGAAPANGAMSAAKAAFQAKTPGWSTAIRTAEWAKAFETKFPGRQATELTAEEWGQFKADIENDYDAIGKDFLVF